jgi:hypothetical protein
MNNSSPGFQNQFRIYYTDERKSKLHFVFALAKSVTASTLA